MIVNLVDYDVMLLFILVLYCCIWCYTVDTIANVSRICVYMCVSGVSGVY